MSELSSAKSYEEYARIGSFLSQILNLDDRLPDIPFRGPGQVAFCEYEVFCSGYFGSTIKNLMQSFCDSEFFMVALEPTIKEYNRSRYVKHGIDFWPAFKIPFEYVEEDFWAALSYHPKERDGDELINTSMVIAACGSSRNWAIWGQRNLGVALIWTSQFGISWWHEGYFTIDINQALENICRLNFAEFEIYERFAQRLIASFEPYGGL